MESPFLLPKMEGTLWKWTNYLSGWQPRWFVLDLGILSYYLSPNEVSQGSRGSLKVASCDIIVHQTDHDRMDIVVPGGRHIYLRAASTAERQQWLIALGSAKQGEGAVEEIKAERVRSEAVKSKMTELHLNCQLLVQQITNIKTAVSSPQPDIKTLTEMSALVSTTCDTFLNVLVQCMDLGYSGGPWPASLKPLSLPQEQASHSLSLSYKATTPLLRKGGTTPMRKVPSNSFTEDELYSSPHPPSPIHPSPRHTSPRLSSPHRSSPPLKHKRRTPTTPGENWLTSSLPTHFSPNNSPIATTSKHVSFEAASESAAIEGPDVSMETKTAPNPKVGTRTEMQLPLPVESETGTRMGHDTPDLDPPTTQEETECSLPNRMEHSSSSKSPGSLQSSEDQKPTLGESKPPEHVDDSIMSFKSSSRLNSDLFLTPTSSPNPTPPPSPKPQRIGDRIATTEKSYQLETLFSRAPTKFEDLVLLKEDGIPTAEFLRCCTAVVPFFDTLGATAFAPVKADINGNIEKLTRKFKENPEQYVTLQAIVLSELQTNTHNARNSATDALLWLKRAMEFIQVFIAEVAAGEQSLDVAAGKAYTKSLRRFHNWIVRGIFSLAVKAVPYRKDFLVTLGSDGTPEAEEAVVDDMANFAHSLGELIVIINSFYQEHNLDAPA